MQMQEIGKAKSCLFCVMVATTGLHEKNSKMVCNVKPEVCFSDLHQVLEEEAMTSESKIKQQSCAFDNISAAAAFDDSSADHDTACDADADVLMASGA